MTEFVFETLMIFGDLVVQAYMRLKRFGKVLFLLAFLSILVWLAVSDWKRNGERDALFLQFEK